MAFRKKQPEPERYEPPKQYYRDQLFPDAVEVTLESQVVSAGRLQSMLRIGSIRATKLMTELEEQGIIGPERGNRPREIFFTMERWNEEKGNFAWKPEPPKPEPAAIASDRLYCPHCKRPTPKDASYCIHCGGPLSSKGKKIGKIIGTIVLIVALLCAAYFIIPDEVFEPAPVLSKSEYIAQCETISYEELARNPDSYKGDYFTFVGEVIQVVEYSNYVQLRVNVTEYEVYGTYFSKDTIYVTTKLPKDGRRILEKDIIRLYGVCEGLYTYTSILGSSVSLPSLQAEYWEIVK